MDIATNSGKVLALGNQGGERVEQIHGHECGLNQSKLRVNCSYRLRGSAVGSLTIIKASDSNACHMRLFGKSRRLFQKDMTWYV